MDKAGDILKEFFSFYNLEGGEKYASLLSSWRKIAGDDIASHSRVADLRGGALIVEVDHPGWMQLLQIKHDEILGKLSTTYPGLGIRMVQGRLVKEGQFSPPSGRAGSTKTERKPSPEEVAPREAGESPGRESGEEASLRKIRSPELREAFFRLRKTLKERSRNSPPGGRS